MAIELDHLEGMLSQAMNEAAYERADCFE